MKRTSSAKWMEKQQRWQINVQKDGVRRSFYSSLSGRAGQREANRKADNWLDEDIEDTNIKVEKLLNKYIEKIEKTTSKANLKKERYHVDSFIRPAIGRKKIAVLKEHDLQSILDNAYRYKNESGEITERSKKTLMNIRATINAFLKFARKMGTTNLVTEDLTIPKGARYKGTTILQPDDLVTLFNVDTTLLKNKVVFDEYIYAYRFAVVTGLRPGELRGLRQADINEGKLFLKRSINREGQLTKGKNENAIRSFVMSEFAHDILNCQQKLKPSAEYVFDLPAGSTFLHRWSRYCSANNIPHTSLYGLRHTFVSVTKSLPEGEIKALVGHSKNMDTYGVYGHVVNGEGEQLAKDVNTIFEGLLNKK